MDSSDPKQITIWLARAIAYLAYAYLILTQIILVQGFLLRLFGANTGSSYVDWAYRSLDRVMAPFRGIFESIELNGNSVLDTSIIFAMVIYGILALLVHSLLDWLTYRLNRLERKRMIEEAQDQASAAAYGAGYGAPAYPDTGSAAAYPAGGAQPVAPTPAAAPSHAAQPTPQQPTDQAQPPSAAPPPGGTAPPPQ